MQYIGRTIQLIPGDNIEHLRVVNNVERIGVSLNKRDHRSELSPAEGDDQGLVSGITSHMQCVVR